MLTRSKKTAVVSLSATGTVVVPVNDEVTVKVCDYEIQSRSVSMTVQFRDGSNGGVLGIRWAFDAREGTNTSGTMPPHFLFETSPGTELQAVITGTGTVDIAVRYWDDWI